MGLTLCEKIIKSHLVDGEYKKGNEVGIRIDQTLTQDATGTMAYLELEAMDIDKVKTDSGQKIMVLCYIKQRNADKK